MKKSEPKLILNLQVDSEELDQKVKLEMDKYIEDVIVGRLKRLSLKELER